MTYMTDAEYLGHGGNRCPVCKSPNISTTDEVDTDGTEGYQGCTCLSCDAIWTDYWQLTGYGDVVTMEVN